MGEQARNSKHRNNSLLPKECIAYNTNTINQCVLGKAGAGCCAVSCDELAIVRLGIRVRAGLCGWAVQCRASHTLSCSTTRDALMISGSFYDSTFCAIL